jgi:hypothetical protein
MSGMLAHALSYAAAGFPVIPLHSPVGGRCDCRRDCESPAKHPRTAHGLSGASTDPDQIRRWWEMWPEANVGLAIPDGYVVVDVDVAEAGTVTAGHELPPTALAKTGRGWHFLYRTPTSVRPAVGVLDHVDLRGPGSYIVAPPSVHLSGTQYVWVSAPGEGIADAPAWILDSARLTAPAVEAAGAPIVEGERNATLTRLGGAMRHQGMTGAEIETALLAVNAARATPPLADDEVRAIASSVGRYAPGERGPRVVLGEAAEPPGIDAADLLALSLPPLRWIVPDLLPEGTTVMASPPKAGKSCLVYQIATEASIGGTLLDRQVSPGSALYLALEDGQRRGQERLRAALAGRTMPRDRLEVRWSARKIGAGLEDDIARWLDAHTDAALVAVDTLGRVRPRSDGRRNAYEVDVEDLGRLQGLFRDRAVALLIVHHSRKEASGDDFLASVSGTYGLTGSADTIVVVRRKRLEAFGSIVVTGRDVADAELPVRFDGLTWRSAPQVVSEASFERTEVYRTIEADGPIFPAAIATKLGLERTSVQHMVTALCTKGAVARTTKGYVVPRGPVIDIARARAYPLSPLTLITGGVIVVTRDTRARTGHVRPSRSGSRDNRLRPGRRSTRTVWRDRSRPAVDDPAVRAGVAGASHPTGGHVRLGLVAPPGGTDRPRLGGAGERSPGRRVPRPDPRP